MKVLKVTLVVLALILSVSLLAEYAFAGSESEAAKIGHYIGKRAKESTGIEEEDILRLYSRFRNDKQALSILWRALAAEEDRGKGKKNGNGQYTDEQVRRFDLNCDGEVSVEDVFLFIWSIRLKRDADFDGDGQFTAHDLDAFKHALEVKSRGDANGDGVTNYEDVLALEWFIAISPRLDLDGNGWVSAEEIEECIMLYEAGRGIDLNGDGFVDAEDLNCLYQAGYIQKSGDLNYDGVINAYDPHILIDSLHILEEGDLNEDGQSDLKDLQIAMKAFDVLCRADFNGDGYVNLRDLFMLIRYIRENGRHGRGERFNKGEADRIDVEGVIAEAFQNEQCVPMMADGKEHKKGKDK